MTNLRTAAQQALEAMEREAEYYLQEHSEYNEILLTAITALKAALEEPEDWELRRLREELERCKQTCAATSEAWREEAALAEPVQKPLSIEQIEEAWDKSNFNGRPNIGFARAIERAHGITNE